MKLVVVSTVEISRVQSGEDASTIKKDFDPKHDLIGEVAEFDGENYVIRFTRTKTA